MSVHWHKSHICWPPCKKLLQYFHCKEQIQSSQYKWYSTHSRSRGDTDVLSYGTVLYFVVNSSCRPKRVATVILVELILCESKLQNTTDGWTTLVESFNLTFYTPWLSKSSYLRIPNIPQTTVQKRVMKIDWSLHRGLMNIWCECEEDPLKTVFYGVHIVDNKVGSLVATNITNEWRRCTRVQIMA